MMNDDPLYAWHPLDGVPPPDDYIPPVWTPEHVGRRLVEGFETLRMMPLTGIKLGYGTPWPTYVHDWADLLAQAEDQQAAQDRERERNRVKMQATSQQVAAMEAALDWMLILGRRRPDLLPHVRRWVEAQVAERPHGEEADVILAGLQIIVDDLNALRRPVF
ncbi:hypothetical protein [Chelatococcus reniformis]|uniref:Uncharacterized protein n=1 Tax=Chelatococcus reniformis TaxID=1494448 RepID=A0A916XNV4_9HYPH|nr:hypothetical protein [Chelatococcus reniformis]GGC90515.1 hypothetical protein GCM10010994_55420 [Chelatococcus reniformis]